VLTGRGRLARAVVVLGTDLVVLGDLDPLVGLHARLAQPLAALHAETDGPRVVLTAGAHLGRTTSHRQTPWQRVPHARTSVNGFKQFITL